MPKYSSANANNLSIMKPAQRNDPDFPAVKNNEFLGVRLDNKNPKTPNLLVFGFKNKRTGDIYSHRELSPENLHTTNLTQEVQEKMEQMLINRIEHILAAFLEDAKENPVSGESWADFCNNLITRLNTKKGAICDLKLVYPNKPSSDGKYYAGFPLVPDFISTELKPKTFVPNFKYELYAIPETVSQPDANPNVATAPASTEDASDVF